MHKYSLSFNSLKYWICLVAVVSYTACVPVPEDNQEEVIVDISNEDIRHIYSLQNRHEVDSLKTFFSDKRATNRYLAALAFGSIQSEAAVDELASLLFDKNKKVRTAAAFALGQIGESRSVESLLEAFDSDENDVNSELNQVILEAVGKCGDPAMLDLMATTSTYSVEDDQLLLGQARGIYRYALRNITSDDGTKRMIEMVVNDAFPTEARVIAANYLYRANGLDLNQSVFQLLRVLYEDPEPRIRMCLGNALAKINNEELYGNLLAHLKNEPDDRVKINIIRGLSNSDQPLLVDSLLSYISHPNEEVALTTLSLISAKASRRHAATLRELSNTIPDSHIRGELLRAALAATPFSYRNTKAAITSQIITEYNNAATDYNKAIFLSALSGDPANYRRMLELAGQAPSPVIQTAVFGPLMNIVNSPNFKNIYRSRRNQNKVKTDILAYIAERIGAGDIGEISAAGELLTAQSNEYREVFNDSLLYATELLSLTGVQNIEARKSLQNALSALTSYTYAESEMGPSKPLNWSTLDNISDNPIAIIVTTKGKITVELTPNTTPATVANFIELTDENFYDRKTIHRVVPNFVIQGGCPRGDGYGSLDYTIRSELPMTYYDDAGYIGMASAGIHTEGVQWFITHSPTPHLDGKYTIFGKVTEGMDVVNNIRIGDIIQDIRILKYN